MPFKKLLEKVPLPLLFTAIFTLFGALFVRLHGLGDFYYTSDDAWHLVVASQTSAWEVLKYNFYQEVHPPLSYLIWHFMLTVSHNELWIRSSSIIPGILLIPSLYVFGRLYIGRAAGYAMAMVAAFGALPVVVSISVRAYSMMILALTWAGIFLYKYKESQQRKYLAYYFALALTAILLNHGAAFPIFAFGTMLVAISFKNKNYKDLAFIIVGHIILASFTAGYGYALQSYWQGRQVCYFTVYFSTLGHFNFFITRFLLNFVNIISNHELFIIPCVFLSLLAPVQFCTNKQWGLLHIVFTPPLLLFFTDYFRLFPFSHEPRNNLFLFLSFTIIVGYFAQLIMEYFFNIKMKNNTSFSALLKDKSIGLAQSFYIIIYREYSRLAPEKIKKLILNILLIAFTTIPIIFTALVAADNYHRDKKPGAQEFTQTKRNMNEVLLNLDKYNTENTILFTEMNNVWQFLLMDGNKATVTYITKNLALYKSDKYHFYFTSFPGIFKNTTSSFYDWKPFFTDLLKELGGAEKKPDTQNFIYFSFNYLNSIIDRAFFPVFIKPKVNTSKAVPFYKAVHKLTEEEYDFGWKVHTSKQITLKQAKEDFHVYNGGFIFLGMTPQFVRENFLQKEFVDITTIYKEMVFGVKKKK